VVETVLMTTVRIVFRTSAQIICPRGTVHISHSAAQIARSRGRDSTQLLVKTTKTDINGYFDFGEIKPGHYTLIVDDNELGPDFFDVEVKQQAKQTSSVTIDVSPVFPDCTGGHEFIVQNPDSQGLGRGRVIRGQLLLHFSPIATRCVARP
jgi:hypothetical protein